MPSRACASCASVERGERNRVGQPRAQRGRQVRSSRRSRRRRPRSTRHAWRARKAGSPASASVRSQELEVHRRSYGGSDMRLAKHLAHAGVASRRAAEQLIFARARDGRRRGRHATRRATSTARSRSRSTAGRSAGPSGARGLHPQQAAPASSRPRTTPTAARPSSTSSTPTAASTRSGGSTPTRTGLILLTDDGELAHRLTHPRFEVPKTYRAVVRNPPVREPALRKLREGIELDDGRTSPAKVRRISSERARDHDPRGPQAPGAPHVRGDRPPRRVARARRLRPAAAGQPARRRPPRACTPAEVERLRAD